MGRQGIIASADGVSDECLRGHIGYGIRRAMLTVQADVAAALAPLGLRMVTFSALAVIRANPGLRPSQLAEVLKIERPNLVAIVDELTTAGLIARARAVDDRRAFALGLTDKGREVAQAADRAMQAHDEKISRGMSAEDRTALLAALARIEAPEKGSER